MASLSDADHSRTAAQAPRNGRCPVIGQPQGELPREIAAGLDDFEGRIHPGDRGADLRPRRVGRQVAVEDDAQLVLEAGLDQRVPAKDMARCDKAFRQQTGEDRLVQPELLLNGRRGQADLPADAARPLVAAAADQGQQDAIGVV
jgi:hypothetical protein